MPVSIEETFPNFSSWFAMVSRGDESSLIAELDGLNETELAFVLETPNKAGKTLLQAMVAQPQIPIFLMNWLLKKGAIVNEQDEQGQSLLHTLLQNSNEDQLWEAVETLLRWDINLSLVNEKGLTAAALAKELQARNAVLYKKLTALLRIRQEWQEELKGCRLNRVIDLIQQTFPSIMPAAGKGKVLLMGITGTGKSTLLNYLNGTRYDLLLGEEDGHLYAVPRVGSVPEVTHVGQTLISATLYPHVIAKDGENEVYCDLPGLQDNRGAEERICAASSLQLLSRLPGDIKGLLVVLPREAFVSKSSDCLSLTGIALAKMLKANPELMDSVCFVVTHLRRDEFSVVTPEGLLKKADERRQALRRTQTQRSLSSDEADTLFMLEQMRTLGPAHLKIANITDGGESAREIANRLQSFRPNASSLYDFVSHDGSQEVFNEFLFKVAKKFLARKRQLEEIIPQELQDEQSHEVQFNKILKEYRDEIVYKTKEMETPFDDKQIKDEIKRLDQKITDNQTAISKNKTELENANTALAATVVDLNFWESDALADMDEVHESFWRNDSLFVYLVRDIFNLGHSDVKEYRLKHQFPYPLRKLSASFSGYVEGTSSYHAVEPKPTKEGAVVDMLTVDEHVGVKEQFYDACQTGLYEAVFKHSGTLSKITVRACTARSLKYAETIRTLTNTKTTLDEQIKAAEKEKQRLATEKENLPKDKERCQRELSLKEGQQKSRNERLQSQIQRVQHDIQEVEQKITLSQKKQLQLNEEAATISVEFEVSQNLLTIVYQASALLGLETHDECIEKFRDAFRSKYPHLASELVTMPVASELVTMPGRPAVAGARASLFPAGQSAIPVEQAPGATLGMGQ